MGSEKSAVTFNGIPYVAGWTTIRSEEDPDPKAVVNIACYWKDGVRTDLPGLTDDLQVAMWDDPPDMVPSYPAWPTNPYQDVFPKGEGVPIGHDCL